MQPDEIQKVVPVTPPAAKKEAGNKIKKVVRFLAEEGFDLFVADHRLMRASA